MDLTKIIDTSSFIFDDSFDAYETNEVGGWVAVGHCPPNYIHNASYCCLHLYSPLLITYTTPPIVVSTTIPPS